MDPSLSESDSSSHAIVIPAPTATGARRRHLHAVDVMRILAVTGVIAVHSITLVDTTANVAAGTALMVLHTSRAIFFALMALVLAYNYPDGLMQPGRRWSSLGRFWRRRYLLVVVPYVVWTVIYFIADAVPMHPLSGAVHTFTLDLLTGAARYHLYFLLVTMQLYLVFPLVMAFIRWTRGYHWLVFLLALAYQLVFTQAHHAGWHLPGVVGFWVRNPDSFLTSYVLYIVVGALLAEHLDQALTLIRSWWPVAILIAIAGSVLALGVYWYEVQVLRQVPTFAAEVFQPAITIESLTATLGLLVLGVAWAAVQRPRWLRPVISDGRIPRSASTRPSAGAAGDHRRAHRARLAARGHQPALQRRARGGGAGDHAGGADPDLGDRAGAAPQPAFDAAHRAPAARRARRARPSPALWVGAGAGLAAGNGAVMVVLLVVVSLAAVNVPAQRALANSGVPNPTKPLRPSPRPRAPHLRRRESPSQWVTVNWAASSAPTKCSSRPTRFRRRCRSSYSSYPPACGHRRGTIVETLNRLQRDGHVDAFPQQEDRATYARKIARDDAAIDWRVPALAIDRQVRALNPFPGALYLARRETDQGLGVRADFRRLRRPGNRRAGGPRWAGHSLRRRGPCRARIAACRWQTPQGGGFLVWQPDRNRNPRRRARL